MTELENKLDEFMKSVPEPLPTNPIIRLQWLARELALGHCNGLWNDSARTDGYVDPTGNNNLRTYYELRWPTEEHGNLVQLLFRNEYIDINHHLTKSAYDLIVQSNPYDVFISYKRSESSPFALLVLARLKEYSLIPFVDMALEAGDNWHADLEERINSCDYFIILLGEDTLASEMTVKEIGWAIDAERTIIPIWHSGFDIGSDRWDAIPAEVKDSIQQTNAIRVLDESASGYNTAIVELLNRFGITP